MNWKSKNELCITEYKKSGFLFQIVSHGRSVPTIKITDLSILCRWENLQKWQYIKYLFSPLCLYVYIYNLFFVFFQVLFVFCFEGVVFFLNRCSRCELLCFSNCALSSCSDIFPYFCPLFLFSSLLFFPACQIWHCHNTYTLR